MKKQKKIRHTILAKDKEKNIVILDMKKTPTDYNYKVLDMYMNAAKASTILVGMEIGKLYGFIASKASNIEEADLLIDLLDRVLNIHMEAGTYNGLKKTIPFKFKTISNTERLNMIQNLKDFKKGLLTKKKAIPPAYSG